MEDMVVDLYKEERKKKFGASWLVVLCFASNLSVLRREM